MTPIQTDTVSSQSDETTRAAGGKDLRLEIAEASGFVRGANLSHGVHDEILLICSH